MVVWDRQGLATLFRALRQSGFELIGPAVRDGAIVCAEIGSVEDLPVGWTDEQEAGRYRLRRRADQALFGYALGPQSWKRFLHPPAVRLWRAERDGADGAFRLATPATPGAPLALIGVRACELAAIAIQDRVLLSGPHVDPVYHERRRGMFVVAVDGCAASPTCFCASLGTGPRSASGFDVRLTEVLAEGRHYLLAESGSAPGEEMLGRVEGRPPSREELAAAAATVQRTAAGQSRALELAGLREALYENLESPHWDVVGDRCLTCGNCTMVCPTCFCTTVEDPAELAGTASERWRRWDSCFSQQFSYAGGGPLRASARSRYRQWLTHKLASWNDQFGTPGCVGCGRCITWCPVGIDITAEARALRQVPATARRPAREVHR